MSKTIKRVLSVLLCAALLFGTTPLEGFAELHWPQLHFPQLHLSQLNLPEWELPKLTLPKISSLFAVKAQAASGTCGKNLTWEYDTTTAILTISGTGAMNDYSSSSYSGTYVTTAPWRPYYQTMQTLVINSGVTSIGSYAFYNCTGLTSVTIPDSVTSIEFCAFRSCTGLTSVTIPDSVTSISEHAFSGCSNLTSMTLPFVGASRTATDSSSVFGYIFGIYGTSLVSGTVRQYSSNNNFCYYIPSSLREITITDATRLPYGAFSNCSFLTSVTIGNSVTSIGSYAFYGCTGLTSVTIGNSVTSIGNSAFYNCTGLTSVTIPDSVTSIGDDAFRGCTNLTSMTLPFVGASRTATFSSGVFGYIFGSTSSSTSGTVRQNYASGNSDYYYYYIPSSLREITITDATQLSYGAFYNCSFLTSVTIPDSVTSIGDYAFYNCTGLTSVTIPDSVASISSYAFSGCTGLTSVTIPDSVASISSYAFSGCTGLTSVTIPDSVTSIGNYAFSGCTGLTSIIIGKGVTSIGGSAFSGCTGLMSFSVDANNLVYSSDGDGILYNKDKTELIRYPVGCTHPSFSIPDSVTSIGSSAFYNCSSLTSVTIPDSVTSIGGSAFSGCTGLTSVTIPNSVTSIGNYAFRGCTGLTSVTIPDSVTSIGNSAFYNCTGLTSVTIGNSVTSIGNSAFYNCTGLTSVTIPDSVTSIGSSAFFGCTGLTSVSIGAGVTSIGESAFYGCTNLTSMTLPFVGASRTATGSSGVFGYIFGNHGTSSATGTVRQYYASGNSYYYYIPSSLREITITDATQLSYGAFYNCSFLTSITISDSITSIDDYAFYNCTGLTEINYNAVSVSDLSSSSNVFYNAGKNGEGITVTFGDSVTKIPAYLFYVSSSDYRPNIKTVTIPDSVTSIGSSAFCYCTGLTSVHISDLTAWYNIAFSSSSSNPLYYAHNLYLNGELVTELVIPNSVTSIGNYAFYNCARLTNLTIPDNVTSIGNSAFSGCTGLTSVTIPDSVTSIGGSAFYGCKGLMSVTIPDSVTSIGNEAFYNCTGLTSVTIGNSVTSIGNSAFYNCTGLTSVTIPDSVTSIGGYAFYFVANVVYHGSASGSPWGARSVNGFIEPPFVFADSTKTKINRCYPSCQGEITIPDSVTSIGDSAFYGCTGLTSVTIGNSVTSIGDSAFYGCTGLTSVTIPDSVTSIGKSAFRGCTGLTSMTLPFVGASRTATDSSGVFGYIFGTYGVSSATGTVRQYYASGNSYYYYIPSSLREITITDATQLSYGAFYNCSFLTNITIPDSIKNIGDDAFYNCTGLTNITIPDSVTSIGNSAFYYCTGLTSVTIPNIVTSIGSFAFSGCTGMTSVTIPDRVTSIGNYAFSGCTGLTSVTIPNRVTSIGKSAFSGCTGLTSVTIGNSVTSIGESAFSGCTGLTEINYNAVSVSDFSSSSNVFYNAGKNGEGITVTFGNSVRKIPAYLFSGRTGLTSVTIGNSVTSIGGSAFSSCTGLTSVTIGTGVTSIGNYAFYNCSKLTDVYYDSTQAKWNAISIGSNNDPLRNATLHLHQHAYTSVTTEPTCTEDGGITYSCYCGETYTEVIPALSHAPSDWIVIRQPVVCTSSGLRMQLCTRCGKTLVTEEIPAHSFGEWTLTTAPTCIQAGEETHICADCGASETRPVDALGHDFGDWALTTDPSCLAQGEETRYCSRCDATETRPVDALGHDYAMTVTAPTCTENGFTTHACSRCDEAFVTDILPALGHTYSAWYMAVDPTATAPGLMCRCCTVCGVVLDEMPVPMLIDDQVSGVTLSDFKVWLDRGETVTLTAAVTPETAANKTVLWSSSKPHVATVDNGVVTAVAPGVAVITAQTEDGGFKDFCVVQVSAATARNGSAIENGLITGLSVNLNSLDNYLALADDAMTLETGSVIGTGTKVYVKQGDTVVNEYETVIFGDVDGDSWYDGTDAYFVRLVANGMISADALTDAQRMAADCNHDGVIDSADAALLEQAGLLLSQVDQTLPSDELQTNSVYLEYCGLIDQSIEIAEPDQSAVTEEPTTEQGSTASVWQIILDLFKRLVNFVTMIFSIIVIPK